MAGKKPFEQKPFIAFCGDICSECPRYLATLSSDPEELYAVADLWYRAGFRNRLVSNEEIQCEGCSRTKSCGYDINSCNHLKNIENCGECEIFPCSKLKVTFERVSYFEPLCSEKCTPDEIKKLRKVFFHKKELLENIHRNRI